MARRVGELLDRLVRRAVLAERDGVVRPDEDRRDVHERREAHRGAHVVAEDQERAAERAGRAVQHDAVDDRAPSRARGCRSAARGRRGCPRPLVGRPLGRDERRRVVDRREVRLGEVGRSAPQLGEHAGERVDDLAGRGAGRDLLAGLERRAARTRCRRAARRPRGGRAAPCARGSPRPTRRTPTCHSACAAGAALAAARGCARARRRRRRRSARGRSRAPSSSRRARRRRARSRGSCRCSACRGRASR